MQITYLRFSFGLVLFLMISLHISKKLNFIRSLSGDFTYIVASIRIRIKASYKYRCSAI